MSCAWPRSPAWPRWRNSTSTPSPWTPAASTPCAPAGRGRGYVVARHLLVYGLRHDHCGLWSDVDAGRVDLFVAANQRVLARALRSVEDFTAECERRGIRLETAELEEPTYTSAMKAEVHRRLSMPTAGYDGT